VLQQDPELRAQDRDAVLGQLEQSKEARERFMQQVQKWEEGKNERPGSRAPKTKPMRVEVTQKSAVQTKQVHGYLWPRHVYFRVKGKRPAATQLTTVEHQGQKVSGVLLDDTHGTPVGVIEVSSLGESACTKTGALAEPSALAETAEAAWQNAQKRQRVTSVPVKNKVGPCLTLRCPAANSKGPAELAKKKKLGRRRSRRRRLGASRGSLQDSPPRV
jgi:hypothetical protein